MEDMGKGQLTLAMAALFVAAALIAGLLSGYRPGGIATADILATPSTGTSQTTQGSGW
jgi:hypothetical protein